MIDKIAVNRFLFNSLKKISDDFIQQSEGQKENPVVAAAPKVAMPTDAEIQREQQNQRAEEVKNKEDRVMVKTLIRLPDKIIQGNPSGIARSLNKSFFQAVKGALVP